MREEPELCVYDLRPMVRELLWAARRDFLMVIFGHRFLPMKRAAAGLVVQEEVEETALSDITTALSATQLQPATVFRAEHLHSEEVVQCVEDVEKLVGAGENPMAPDYVCRVFCNLALVKSIVQFLV
jgi:hypothetical protein